MPLDARDGHAAVSRAAKMRAGLPTRAANRAGSARGAIERSVCCVWFRAVDSSGEAKAALVLATKRRERSVRETSVASRISSWVAFGVPQSKRHEKPTLSIELSWARQPRPRTSSAASSRAPFRTGGATRPQPWMTTAKKRA